MVVNEADMQHRATNDVRTPGAHGSRVVEAPGMQLVFTRPTGRTGLVYSVPIPPHGGVESTSHANGKTVTVYKDGTVEILDPSDGSRKTYPPLR